MGIFTGIEVLFFFLGVLTTLSVLGILYLKIKTAADTQTLLLSTLGLLLLVFTVAWSVSSVLEQEHQAANMGLLFFGLPAVLFMGMAWKRLSATRSSEE